MARKIVARRNRQTKAVHSRGQRASGIIPIQRMVPHKFLTIKRGMKFETPAQPITPHLMRGYIKLLGEEYAHNAANYAQSKGFSGAVVPANLIMAIGAGQFARLNPLAVRVAKQVSFSFFKAVIVGDSIRTQFTVTAVRPHRDASKDYGYVWVRRDVFNQRNELVYTAKTQLLIDK